MDCPLDSLCKQNSNNHTIDFYILSFKYFNTAGDGIGLSLHVQTNGWADGQIICDKNLNFTVYKCYHAGGSV